MASLSLARAGIDVPAVLKEAAIAAGIAAALGLPLVGLKTGTVAGGISLTTRFPELLIAVALVFVGRVCLALLRGGHAPVPLILGVILALVGWQVDLPSQFLTAMTWTGGLLIAVMAIVSLVRSGTYAGPPALGATLDKARRSLPAVIRVMVFIGLAGMLLLPLMPFADRRLLDIGILVMTYVMLGWGLNIVVGLAGLLDLGYVAFYAVGAYSFALLATQFDLSFWVCLPLAGAFAAFFGMVLGFPVLRLRGDYLAIVTLGFGEMIRVILLNWVDFTKGPDGISGIPRPTFFGLPFRRRAEEGTETFHQFFGLEYSSIQRIVFLYYLILVLALITNFFTLRMRKLPLGRAWEALREDEIACRSLGINPTNTKLTAFSIGAMFGGFAGAFFATRQGFISPESFSFIESAIILAVVVLGGMGSQIGVVIAAVVLIGLPEWVRDLQEYRMLAFGAGMVLIMIWRPSGLMAHREPTIRFGTR